jgi:hypothetical protein
MTGTHPAPELEVATQEAADALTDWRNAPPGRAAERRAARMMAYRLSCLLRALGLEV